MPSAAIRHLAGPPGLDLAAVSASAGARGIFILAVAAVPICGVRHVGLLCCVCVSASRKMGMFGLSGLLGCS